MTLDSLLLTDGDLESLLCLSGEIDEFIFVAGLEVIDLPGPFLDFLVVPPGFSFEFAEWCMT